MLQTFAGFYCSPTELAENAAYSQKVTIFGVIILVFYIGVWVGLNKVWGGTKKARIILKVCMILVGVVLILMLALMRFSTPHWCGNG